MNKLEQKIIEEFDRDFLPKLEEEEKLLAYAVDYEDVKSWLKSQLSLYRQQLLQEFRIGREAGKREVLEEVKKEVNNLRHEIQQDKMPLGNEQWKEGHTECLTEVLGIITNLTPPSHK